MNKTEYNELIQKSVEAQKIWQDVPVPRRGELIRYLALRFGHYKQDLAADITRESRKVILEAHGEV